MTALKVQESTEPPNGLKEQESARSPIGHRQNAEDDTVYRVIMQNEKA